MSSRISSAALLPLALLACGRPDAAADQPAPPAAEAQARARVEQDGRIPCAQGDGAFARTCTVERLATAGGLVLTVRDGDGGFHRLRVTDDGRGVAAADGAEPARVTLAGEREIEVAIGDARYRLPATMKAATAAE